MDVIKFLKEGGLILLAVIFWYAASVISDTVFLVSIVFLILSLILTIYFTRDVEKEKKPKKT